MYCLTTPCPCPTPQISLCPTDNELLMQFVRHRNEEAFRQLVERHAAMVMSVCRQVTRSEQDAEDAFQATWLILAHRADRLIRLTSLGGWLHRVAFHTALRAERKRTKLREGCLIEETVIEQEEVLRQIHVREIQRVLHEEAETTTTSVSRRHCALRSRRQNAA